MSLTCRWRPSSARHRASWTRVSVLAALLAATVVAAPSDFAVENGSMPCEVVDVAPASYPLAVVLDTSGQARADFRTLQLAARRFVEALSPRPLAVYTSGGPGTRVQDFTTDRTRIVRAMADAAASPNASTNTLETIRRASSLSVHVKAPAIIVMAMDLDR